MSASPGFAGLIGAAALTFGLNRATKSIMHAMALEAARGRLERAKDALRDFKAAKDYGPAEAAWTDFLLACNTFFSKLEQGAKGTSQSEYWFGLKRRQRKDDSVLSYIHKARDVDEHGIVRVTARGIDGGFNLGFGEKREFFIQGLDDNKEPIDHPDQRATGWSYGPYVKLVPVYVRRERKKYDPPYKVVFPAADPAVVGDAALKLLAIVLSEAEALPKSAGPRSSDDFA
jgi:hypothetical protein